MAATVWNNKIYVAGGSGSGMPFGWPGMQPPDFNANIYCLRMADVWILRS